MQEPRLIAPQPNRFSAKSMNHRKLVELPHSQIAASQVLQLKSSLFDFDFIQAKCVDGLVYQLIADYESALEQAIAKKWESKDKGVATKLEQYANLLRQEVILSCCDSCF